MPYPNTPGKHEHDSVYTPADFLGWALRSGWDPGTLPVGVVFTFQGFLTRHLTDHPDDFVEAPALAPSNSRVFLTAGEPAVAVSCLNAGGATMAAQMEHLLFLGDTRRFAVVGTAGGLVPDMQIAERALVTRALRDEGISHHYLPPGRYVDAPGGLTADLRAELRQRFGGVAERTTWTVPVPYRTTADEVAAYIAEGVSVVEMEIASLFAVAQARGAEAAAAVVISDVARVDGVEVEWRDANAPLVELLDAAIAAIRAVPASS